MEDGVPDIGGASLAGVRSAAENDASWRLASCRLA
jgi:hypothetical protein